MPKKPFLPRTDAQRADWLDNFVTKLQDSAKSYAAKYNVSAATITDLDNGRQWFRWSLDNLATVRDASTTLTSFKNQVSGGTAIPGTPVAPAYSAAPAGPIVAGVISLASSVGSQIKTAKNYDPTDGTDLGLEGADIAAADPATTQPLISTRPASGGLTEIVWPKGEFDAIKLMVDRGDGKGEVFLAMDSEPNYVDTVKPAAGTSAIYTYRGIYMLHDAEFGQWSLPVTATLRG
jgi:hypothetical protein